jgi:hypothetical protein
MTSAYHPGTRQEPPEKALTNGHPRVECLNGFPGVPDTLAASCSQTTRLRSAFLMPWSEPSKPRPKPRVSGLLPEMCEDLTWIVAMVRVRPKMMTVVAIMAGLLPTLWSTGIGSEVMRRIAVPMVGGMVSSTAFTLLVIPALYAIVKGWRLPRDAAVKAPEPKRVHIPAE